MVEPFYLRVYEDRFNFNGWVFYFKDFDKEMLTWVYHSSELWKTLYKVPWMIEWTKEFLETWAEAYTSWEEQSSTAAQNKILPIKEQTSIEHMKELIQKLAETHQWNYELHEVASPPPLLTISFKEDSITPGLVLRIKNVAEGEDCMLDLWLPSNGIGGSYLSHSEAPDCFSTYELSFDVANPAPAVEKVVNDFLL